MRVGKVWGRRGGGVEQPILLSFFLWSPSPLFPVSRVKGDFADERFSRHGAQGWIPRVEIYILGIAVCGETTFGGVRF